MSRGLGDVYKRQDDDGTPCDWWAYEDLRLPMTRVMAAAGFPREEVQVVPITFDEMRPGCYDRDARLEDMDTAWIEASLNYPTFPRFCGQTFAEAKDKDLALLCVKAYNDWMVEDWCAPSGGRLIPMCLIPLWDPEAAAVEVRRNADRGVRAADFQFGGAGADTLTGDDGADVLLGGGGDDYLRGNDNDDLFRGGNGADSLYGGDGADELFGGGQDDKISGGLGRDLIDGGNGDDTLLGDAGSDSFYGGLGDDDIYGNTWSDAGKATKDKAHYDGNFADYSFEAVRWYHSSRGEYVDQLIVTDAASGGADGFYEGEDRLMDIDVLVFLDQTVTVESLI